jgi:hypothetical protein
MQHFIAVELGGDLLQNFEEAEILAPRSETTVPR